MIAVATKELDNAFRKFDLNNSGYLEKNEFAKLIQRLCYAFNV